MAETEKILCDVADASGKHRLILRYVALEPGYDVMQPGYDFDAVIWLTQDDGTWRQKLSITRADFERGSERERCVSEIHSFDPVNGHAIIKMAEGDAPKTATSVHFFYSWREWNLLTNREVRLIRVFENPFEKF